MTIASCSSPMPSLMMITCKEAESGLDKVRAGVAADGGRVE